ncbi:MAG: TusE/DsrC/DsvC family sulfur relay protein [Desulforhopalus sp.]|nr:TusE/DsrC/DsvC family sulfur relay protein [Desulforhopalus sp.]
MSAPSSPEKTGLSPVVRTIGQREVVFDNEGFLYDFRDWDEDLYHFLAAECGLGETSERHLRVIRFLREFYASHGRAPLNNQLRKGTDMTLLEIEALFPGGIKNGARRLAGLPNPQTCS